MDNIERKKLTSDGKKNLKVAYTRSTGLKAPKSTKKTLRAFEDNCITVAGMALFWNQAMGFIYVDSCDGEVYVQPIAEEEDFIDILTYRTGAPDYEIVKYYDKEGRELILEIIEIDKVPLGRSVAEEAAHE